MSTDRKTQLLLLVRQLRSLYRHLHNARPISCTPSGSESLTRAQSELLSVVAKHETGVMAATLADTLQISGGAVTQLVDPLVDKGLLARSANPHDRRSILISATRRQKRSSSFDEVYAAHVSPMFEGLTEKELAQFINLMQKIKAKEKS